ncbi:MAG: capsule assembly Wzi family protein [Ignavibacteria bacterium]|nr:capsule assembly Wzi family protein [Ignavibacteria bacterium]
MSNDKLLMTVIGHWSFVISVAIVCFTNTNLYSQVENVPVGNQVYEYLNRMNVKGILPQYSSTILPISRKEIGDMLKVIETKKEQLSSVDKKYLEKFQREFAFELGVVEQNSLLFKSDMKEIFSDKEKYLYAFQDSSATMYLEFLGSLFYKTVSGNNNTTNFETEQHGVRIRGTFKNRLGYFISVTNGTVFGDRNFALTEPRLRQNYKFNDLNTPYFDETEAYLRGDADFFQVEIGREYTTIGTGFSDKLLLSQNAPVFDLIRFDMEYKSLRFVSLQGRLEQDKPMFSGLTIVEDIRETKYLALHRLEFPLLEKFKIGLSEMIIYQRFSPEWAYLNPFTFYKSLEHALGDRDNAFMSFDVEYFPFSDYKLYGTMLLDDIDFPKVGNHWWGNELGWQAGIFHTNFFSCDNLDAVAEYTRIEPYVYSNRVQGNDYSHRNVGLGHHLQPNSDEIFFQLNYRASEQLRLYSSVAFERHGENYFQGSTYINVGGNVLEGHRSFDDSTAYFLDGNLLKTFSFQLRASYEPINNFFVIGLYEFKNENETWHSKKISSNYFSFQVRLEY